MSKVNIMCIMCIYYTYVTCIMHTEMYISNVQHGDYNQQYSIIMEIIRRVYLKCYHCTVQFSSVQLPSRVQLFAAPRAAARSASLSSTNSWSLLKLMRIKSVMSSNHLSLYHPLLLLPSIFPSIRVFSNESTQNHVRIM